MSRTLDGGAVYGVVVGDGGNSFMYNSIPARNRYIIIVEIGVDLIHCASSLIVNTPHSTPGGGVPGLFGSTLKVPKIATHVFAKFWATTVACLRKSSILLQVIGEWDLACLRESVTLL